RPRQNRAFAPRRTVLTLPLPLLTQTCPATRDRSRRRSPTAAALNDPDPRRRPAARQTRAGNNALLAALEPHCQIITDLVDRDPLLRHRIALAHGRGVVLK